jgi:hypothetical protein
MYLSLSLSQAWLAQVASHSDRENQIELLTIKIFFKAFKFHKKKN